MVGYASKKGVLSSHTYENCPNCKGNLIAFNRKCAKKTGATRMARQGRRVQHERIKIGRVTGTNRVALRTR